MLDFFTLSKIARWLVEPSLLFSLVFFLSAVLLFTPWWRIGRIGMALLLAFGALVSALPLTGWAKTALEYRFPVPELPTDLDGVIVLGGSIGPSLPKEFVGVSVNSNFERFLTFVQMSKLYPNAKMIYTGGVGSLHRDQEGEANIARKVLLDLGLNADKVLFEAESRNTFENAVFSKKLAGDVGSQRWLLITSARHMPRAVGVFRKQGWNVLPLPVDFATNGIYSWQWTMNMVFRIREVRPTLNEWVGLVAYRIKGYTDELFPAPTCVSWASKC